jgi:surface antigen
MRVTLTIALAALALGCSAVPALADAGDSYDPSTGELPAYVQCVPYVRELTGIQIYGDARTWWDQAEGRYARGHTPQVGAVMAFEPHGNMRLGHVAAVSRVIDSRTVLLRHANWSPIDGHRGQIEDNVEAVDVSPNNDWSEVRVWYAPIHDLGTTAWPVAGFIYPNRDTRPALQVVRADPPRVVTPSREFLTAFASYDSSKPARQSLVAETGRKKARAPVDLLAQIASN